MDNGTNVQTVKRECIEVAEAIRAQGINDLASWPSFQSGFTIVYGCLFLLGLLGNGSVLLAFAQNKRLRSARNLFLLNLILTDILLCLTAVPVTPWYALTKDWSFGSLMCRVVPLSNSCAVFVTSWSLTAIAVDKFMHIIDLTREQFSLRTAGFVTFIIWTLSSLLNIPYLLSYELVNGDYYVPKNSTPFCGQFCDELNWSGDTQRRLYGTGVMLFQFVVPTGIITYCYWRILRKVHKDMIVQNVQFSKSLSNSQRTDALNRKKRVNYILIGMVIAFIGCNTPITAVNLVKDFKQEPSWLKKQPYLWPLVAHVIAMSTIVFNPFLFFWLTAKDKGQKGNLTGIATTTSEIITSLMSRMHSLRSTGGNEEARLKRMNKRALQLQRCESAGSRRTANGTSIRLGQLSSALPLSQPLLLRENGHTATVHSRTDSSRNSPSGMAEGRRSPLAKAYSLRANSVL
uniref:G-protein coupled receptors family 1 profile domain-containing protein n=1 Tax=Globodera rostochiensis TaxID=31243 RepID=A0A914HJ31_GLORO